MQISKTIYLNKYISCLATSNNLILNTVSYNSDDPELKDIFGPLVVSNTVSCDGQDFTYQVDIKAQRISDNSNALITNFATVVKGATTSDAYLSIQTPDYQDFAYLVSVTITVRRRPDLVSIMQISKKIYLNQCLAISNQIILNPASYNSGETELKDLFGPMIVLNTKCCDGFSFTYSVNTVATWISGSTVSITNFATVVKGATTSEDYLSISTPNYQNSAYTVKVTITVKRPDQVEIMQISKTIYLNQCRAISNYLILDPVSYNSGDLKLKDIFGPKVVSNTMNCDGYSFTYSVNAIAQRTKDNTDVLITDFATVVQGATTSDDYLSIQTQNYQDSLYIVYATITVTFPDQVSIMLISKTIFLNKLKAILEPAFYNSGDKQQIMIGTEICKEIQNCGGYRLNYSVSTIGKRFSDNSDVLIEEFVSFEKGATISGDKALIFKQEYQDSPYNVSVKINVTNPDKILIMEISQTIYLDPYLAKFIVPPGNDLKFIQLSNTDNFQDLVLQLVNYFQYIPNLTIYTSCNLVDETGNEIAWLSRFTYTNNTCSFFVDKSKQQLVNNAALLLIQVQRNISVKSKPFKIQVSSCSSAQIRQTQVRNNSLIIDVVKNGTKNYTVSLKDKFQNDMQDDCPIVSYSIVKVFQKIYGLPIDLDQCQKLFKVDSQGDFVVLESNQSYQNYLIHAEAENAFGIKGGSSQYLIDLSYQIYPQFSQVETVVIMISDQMIGSQKVTIRVSSDVTSIRIKNSENLPYLTVTLTTINFDLTDLDEQDVGSYEITIELKNEDHTAYFPFYFEIKSPKAVTGQSQGKRKSLQEDILRAKIGKLDCFGKIRIPFSQSISIIGINASDINSSNTDIRIFPYFDQSIGEVLNLTKYKMTWNATKLTELELTIQLEFEEPELISRNWIYDLIQVSFNTSYKFLLSKKRQKPLDKSSRLLTSEIPPQAERTYAIEVFEEVVAVQKTTLWVQTGLGSMFWFVGMRSSMRTFVFMKALTLAVHLPVLQVGFPPVTITFLKGFLKIVNFDPIMALLDHYKIKLIDDQTATISRMPRQMKILGYESDNVINNLGTSSLIILLLLLALVLLMVLLLLFKIIRYLTGELYVQGLVNTIIVTLISMSKDAMLQQLICSYLALRDPQFENFTQKLSVFLALFFLMMTCIVFVSTILFINHDETIKEEVIIINRVALDMALADIIDPLQKKEKTDSSNNNAQGQEAEQQHNEAFELDIESQQQVRIQNSAVNDLEGGEAAQRSHVNERNLIIQEASSESQGSSESNQTEESKEEENKNPTGTNEASVVGGHMWRLLLDVKPQDVNEAQDVNEEKKKELLNRQKLFRDYLFEILEGFDKTTPLKRVYHQFYFFQRLAFVAIALFMTHESMAGLQIVCVFLLNLCTLIYVGRAQALEGRDLNRTDLMNETFLCFICFYLVAFTDFAQNQESRNLAGWFVNILICLMLTINMFFIIIELGSLTKLAVIRFSRQYCYLCCNNKSKRCPAFCFKIKEWLQQDNSTFQDLVFQEMQILILQSMSKKREQLKANFDLKRSKYLPILQRMLDEQALEDPTSERAFMRLQAREFAKELLKQRKLPDNAWQSKELMEILDKFIERNKLKNPAANIVGNIEKVMTLKMNPIAEKSQESGSSESKSEDSDSQGSKSEESDSQENEEIIEKKEGINHETNQVGAIEVVKTQLQQSSPSQISDKKSNLVPVKTKKSFFGKSSSGKIQILNAVQLSLNQSQEEESKVSRSEQIKEQNSQLFINEGHLTFRQANQVVEMSIISRGQDQIYQDEDQDQIHQDEVDEYFSNYVYDFTEHPTLQKDSDGQIFKQVIERHPSSYFNSRMIDEDWQTLHHDIDQKLMFDEFQKSCKILLENIPRKQDSVEVKRKKLSILENVVSENIKQEKIRYVKRLEYCKYLDQQQIKCFTNLHNTYPQPSSDIEMNMINDGHFSFRQPTSDIEMNMINDGHVSFRQPTSDIEMNTISRGQDQFYQDEVDEYLPSHLPDFLNLPIFKQDLLSKSFQALISKRAVCFFNRKLLVAKWQKLPYNNGLDHQEMISQFRKQGKKLLENMPSVEDSVEERKRKVSRLEYIVNEHLKQAKCKDENIEYFNEIISIRKTSCYNDIRETFALKN